jgi:hypothetical protein
LVAYVGVEFVVLMALFIGEYSTVMLQTVDIMFFLVCMTTVAFGSFVIRHLYDHMKDTGEISGFDAPDPYASGFSSQKDTPTEKGASHYQESEYV